MNERIKELAEQAGFLTWSDEEWKPEGAVIDWASDYDKELEKFAELIRADEREACAAIADKELGNTMMLTSLPPKSSAAWNIATAIRARGE